ncbi:MAG: arylesterase [Acidobacteria bacterium]|jgi:acyl-CoA thioesterase-1|nr:arylesterase [Acidobacteriota bacterium]MDP7340055.1 arylesterase [Vicinamibacterales bacterium]MDP7691777.1 arylesterase [Vicinamibacterales bacterium]HJN45804.1 arylesterase [Vicinamibacterales bacterium]
MLSQRGRKLGGAAAIVLGAALTGCGAGAGSTQPVERATQGPTVAASAPSPIRDLGPLLVALGDSLTAGLGLETDQAYPALLERQLRTEGLDLTVINAGVSGDTTAAGLRRAEWALEGDVRAVIVALGGNDGLRGLPIDQMKQNLADIVSLARSRGIAVLLAGMEAPPNFGVTYTAQFRGVFQELAREHDVAFMPFLLDGVAGDPALNQADGIHPNAAGAAIVAVRVREALKPLGPVLTAASQ